MTEEAAGDTPRHPIKVVARRTGLTPATLRAWERRHGAVQPARSGTERRLYSDADILRLRLMRELAAQGHSIAQLARASTTVLAALADDERELRSTRPDARDSVAAEAASAQVGLDACERAVRALYGAELHRQLMRALVERGPMRFVDDLVAPLCRRIGALWEDGTLSVAHEHVASAAIRQALGFLLETLRVAADDAPRMVVTTPAGQRHEFGAMMAAAIAATSGWNVTYLVPDLPVGDIAAAVRQSRARILALSIITTRNAPALAEELRGLRAAVGPRTTIVAGGAAVDSFAPALDAAGALRVADLGDLRQLLDEARPLAGAT